MISELTSSSDLTEVQKPPKQLEKLSQNLVQMKLELTNLQTVSRCVTEDFKSTKNDIGSVQVILNLRNNVINSGLNISHYSVTTVTE